MKKLNKTIYVVFLLSMLTIIGCVPVSRASTSSAEETALAFIEKVLPFDSKQYTPILRSYSVPDMPGFGPTYEILTYTLESKDSTIDVICTIQNNAVSMAQIYVVSGKAHSDQAYDNVIGAAKGFLQNYQTHSAQDSAKMINMLSKIKSVENAITVLDDIKLTVSHEDLTGTVFGDSVDFSWIQTIYECEYPLITVSFRDGVLSNFNDRRVVSTIGDTSVNVSENEAIQIALNSAKSYSYHMSEDWVVSDFEVVEAKIEATLHPLAKESNVLYPVWTVTLPLNGVYPGSVTELLVEVWAGTGEVHLINYQAYGGATLFDNGYILAPESTIPSNSGTFALIAVALTAILAVAITITIIEKKRNK
jgi:hypothetical protein